MVSIMPFINHYNSETNTNITSNFLRWYVDDKLPIMKICEKLDISPHKFIDYV
jgi:hypothetical protein